MKPLALRSERSSVKPSAAAARTASVAVKSSARSCVPLCSATTNVVVGCCRPLVAARMESGTSSSLLLSPGVLECGAVGRGRAGKGVLAGGKGEEPRAIRMAAGAAAALAALASFARATASAASSAVSKHPMYTLPERPSDRRDLISAYSSGGVGRRKWCGAR